MMQMDSSVRAARGRRAAIAGEQRSAVRRMRGFTLTEMVVTAAVAAMLVGFAGPSFDDTVKNAKQVSEYNTLTKAFRYARSEAIKRSDAVAVCARASDSSCGSDWSNGWLVFADSVDMGGSPSVLDAGDPVLRVNRSSDDIEISAAAIVRPNAMSPQNAIRFSSRGRADWAVGTVVVCDSRGASEARALIVNGAGGLRKSEAQAGSPPLNAIGDPVVCP